MLEKIKKNITKMIESQIRNNEQWCRVIMNKHTREMITSMNYSRFDVLEISGTAWSQIGFKSYESLSYPEFDICDVKSDKKYDLIIAEQVFEHVLRPFQGGKNIYSMLNDDGYFLITVPFLIMNHPTPHDCTRWTSIGLKYFLSECGFNINKLQTFSWGNRKCVIANFNSWVKYRPILHSLRNEENYPIVVWGLAQR
jgi:hypothetical protein